MRRTLHITSGDCAGNLLVKSGSPGEVFVWHDILYDGPRNPRWPDDDTLDARARLLEQATAGGLGREYVLGTMKEQYRKLTAAGDYKPLVQTAPENARIDEAASKKEPEHQTFHCLRGKIIMTFTKADLNDLKKAKTLLENPGVAAKITNLFGTPIEKGFGLMPANWSVKVGEVTRAALTKAAYAAVFTMKDVPGEDASNIWHKIAVATTGGIGGFFGLPALAIELPISTTIMLRSIADIARSEGETIGKIDTQIACMEVFALGGPSKKDDASESGYFAIRAALAQSVAKAAEFMAGKGLAEEGAPALVRLIVQIAERFSIQVSEKAAAQAVPAIGAAGGALINSLFIDHFQDMARGHFIVRRFERKYGKEIVEATYKTV